MAEAASGRGTAVMYPSKPKIGASTHGLRYKDKTAGERPETGRGVPPLTP